MADKPITNRFGDIEGNSLFRLFRLYVLFKCLPIVNIGAGPTLLFLVKAMVFHYISRPVYRIAIRFESPVARFFEWRAARRRTRTGQDVS